MVSFAKAGMVARLRVLGGNITSLSHQLTAVLDQLPVSISLFSRDGRVLGKAGGAAPMFNGIIPALNAQEAARWSFVDRQGAAIPRTQWASARAFRGERNYAGLVGTFRNGEEHKVRVTCLPVSEPDSDVAVVAFLQLLNARSRAVDGSQLDLQARLIDQLAKAVTDGRQNISASLVRPLAS